MSDRAAEIFLEVCPVGLGVLFSREVLSCRLTPKITEDSSVISVIFGAIRRLTTLLNNTPRPTGQNSKMISAGTIDHEIQVKTSVNLRVLSL